MTERELLQALLVEQSQSAERRGEVSSITLEDLVALRRGELDPARSATVQRILGTDRGWADLMLELAHFQSEGVSLRAAATRRGEIRRQWRQLQERLRPPAVHSSALGRAVARHPLVALAASLLLGAGLALLMLWWTPWADSSRADERTLVITLASAGPADQPRRSTRPAALLVTLPPDTAWLHFRVRTPQILRNATFRYEIWLENQAVRRGKAWSDEDHYISCSAQRRGLLVGQPHRLRIVDQDGETVAEAGFVLQPRDGTPKS